MTFLFPICAVNRLSLNATGWPTSKVVGLVRRSTTCSNQFWKCFVVSVCVFVDVSWIKINTGRVLSRTIDAPVDDSRRAHRLLDGGTAVRRSTNSNFLSTMGENFAPLFIPSNLFLRWSPSSYLGFFFFFFYFFFGRQNLGRDPNRTIAETQLYFGRSKRIAAE